ncbi:MAG: hypothetical protein CME62_03085 [Halobacteriovoraceae bacterium]|nr:hypothetical protein [Halobacteriovoraceae bacterium]|tara:strand:- start:3348 stop:4631 length:1284 start_codon:yes stop_codon:yes gene_type:complete
MIKKLTSLLFKKQRSSKKEFHTQSKYFCVLPWIHIHGLPDGRVLPCCVSEFDDSYGDLNQNSLKEVWNNKKYNSMRLNMLQDKPVSSCYKCYELEESHIHSMRQRMNEEFKQTLPEIIPNTEADGSLKKQVMKYLDFRFSNICNFKCRGCSPALSTTWYDDHQKLWDFKSPHDKLINITSHKPEVWSEIKDQLPHLEKAYFAGGEPLLMEEHYQCLEYLIENNHVDVALSYNTNLSVLRFKKYDLIAMWKKFKRVDIMLSLDDIESRGEYFRSGLKWETLLKNMKAIKEELPHVYTHINCTVSLFNIHRLPQIHQTVLKLGFINENGFILNTLQDPVEYRTQVLSQKHKALVALELTQYCQSLKNKFPDQDWSNFTHSVNAQIEFMLAEDLSHKAHDFKKVTLKLDQIREESFSETYPELRYLVGEA